MNHVEQNGMERNGMEDNVTQKVPWSRDMFVAQISHETIK